MTTVTLLEKAYGSFSPRTLESILSRLCKDLRVNLRVKGKATRDWVQIEIAGEDELVAQRLIDREVGLAPITAEKVGRFSEMRGRVINSILATTELRVDIGVFAPKVCDAAISLQRLQAQLADGKNLTLQGIAALFCLHDYAPLRIKIVSGLSSERSVVEAEPLEAQVLQFSDWLESNLDRLIVLGASHNEVEEAVEKARHFRDIVKIEALGLFEHAILCKLGTDAVGLMPKLGPYLRSAYLAPFSPRKIRGVIRREEC